VRFAPLFAAFATAAGLVGFSAATGQLPPDKAAKADPDLDQFQGDWVVTKIDMPPGEKGPPPELVKQVVITVRGNFVTSRLTGPDVKGAEPVYHLIALNSAKTPRELDVIKADEKGKERRLHTIRNGVKSDAGPWLESRAIYKFDGDKLVICAGDTDSMPRPTAFKTGWRGEPLKSAVYAVAYLSKKK
jgi:uncharacterized protein (TIGR03067 family)